MDEEKRRIRNRKIVGGCVIGYVLLGLVVAGFALGGAVLTHYEMDRQYQGYYYLATDAGSPETVSDLIGQYLTSVEDVHGYGALIWKNPSTDMDYRKQIVESFKSRADDLCERKTFDSQRINVQLSFAELTKDMEDKQLPMMWWYVIHFRLWIVYGLIFFLCIWWWTFLILYDFLDKY
jgi:hypothetical protein